MKARTFIRILLIALFVAIPFGTKKFLFSFATPFSNFYTSEYTSAFLFGTDLIILACGALLLAGMSFRALLGFVKRHRGISTLLTVLLLSVLISVALSNYPAFAGYAFFRFAIAGLAGLVAWSALRRGIVEVRHVMGALAVSAVFQAIVAFLQFTLQRSVGLRWLGETLALGSHTPGIATVLTDGVQLLRSYGTLPHANVLAAFLVLGLVALCYLFLTTDRLGGRARAIAGVIIVETGLLLTFSRSGWIVAAVAVVAVLAIGFMDRARRHRAWMLTFALALSLAILIGALQAIIVPRATLSAGEGPVRDRLRYNEMGVAIIAARPLGVGMGNELFYAYDRGMFQTHGLPARGQWQPIHNLYLLAGSEIGIVGLACLMALFFVGFRNVWRRHTMETNMVVLMFASLLLFGLFDHFLWDLQAGRLMLWSTLGIMWGISARSSTDRTYPSEG